jgi:hypothetical protein
MIVESRIERVVVDNRLQWHISRWKGWRRYGWQITALVAPDERTVVALACRTRSSPRARGRARRAASS